MGGNRRRYLTGKCETEVVEGRMPARAAGSDRKGLARGAAGPAKGAWHLLESRRTVADGLDADRDSRQCLAPQP